MAGNRVEEITDLIKIQNVIISVSDKKKLEYLVNGLFEINSELKIFSTGGTFKKISSFLNQSRRENLISISGYTGQPEMQGGLVKTLDFKLYLGLLSEPGNIAHQKDLERVGGVTFDMVVVNLYPFEKTVAERGDNAEDARNNIDIGGPSMLRASAKNFLRVVPLCDPSDYKVILEELKSNKGKISFKTRFLMARKAFNHTAEYDRVISSYFRDIDFSMIQKVYRITG